MRIRRGIAVSPGVVVGEAFVLDSAEFPIPRRRVQPEEVEAELARFHEAHKKSVCELQDIYVRAEERLGKTAAIFAAYIAVLEDPSLVEQIETEVRDNRFSAEYAVYQVARRYAKRIAVWGDREFLVSRRQDLREIERRLLRNLQGRLQSDLWKLDRNVVVVAHDLTPSQVLTLDRRHVLAILTDQGGKTSHVALLAQALGIPAVTGLEDLAADICGGDEVVVDANKGVVIVHPDEETRKKYLALHRNLADFELRLVAEVRELPAVTQDGCRALLMANIEAPADVPAAVQAGAEGIGLYRTEFLFLASGQIPDESVQFEAYRRAVEQLGPREMIIRTVDLGADKMSLFAEGEPNPFLGLRAIRLCLREPELFRTQIRAILRASALGKVKMLFPMIASVEEIRAARAAVEEAKDELRRERIPFNENLPLGVMIEIPSAALLVDLIMREVDFVSIGTNDLIQYTLAVDRVNEHVAGLYQPAHPAVLRLISRVLQEGLRAECPVGLCGEMGGNTTYTLLLLGMGLREFSVPPGAIASIKRLLRRATLAEAKEIAAQALVQRESADTERLLRERTRKILPEAF